jgi:hypothetical protein
MILKKAHNKHSEKFLALYHINVMQPLETNEQPLTKKTYFYQITSNVEHAGTDSVDNLIDGKIGDTYWLA